MKNIQPKGKLIFMLAFLFSSQILSAQGGLSGMNLVILTLVGLVVVLFFVAFFSLSDNLLQIEAKKSGIDTESKNLSILPGLDDIFGKSKPAYLNNQKIHRLKKGYNINLVGEADTDIVENPNVTRYAVKPPNFRGLAPIPRVLVEVGDEVKAGDVIFHDKKDDRVKFVAPVSGEIMEIRRGPKRAITDIIILADKKIRFKTFDVPNLKTTSRSELVSFMLESGVWSLLNERPYDLAPDPGIIPQNIFISTFDTGPLAPNLNMVVDGKAEFFQKGLDVLRKMTDGAIHLGLNGNHDEAPHSAFTEAQGVEKHWFMGSHPAGNVGVQIHHIAPIRSTHKVWTAGVQEVITIGELFEKGVFNTERIVALVGAELNEPKYLKTYIGANVGDIVKNNIAPGNMRIIAGDVLSGEHVQEDDFLSIHDDQVTVVEEGDYFEMFGWLLPIKPRPSISRTFPGFLIPNHKYTADTNTHGESRAFVVTGQYESVLPMDIYPQHLMKAIMAEDFEQMEGLGLNELTEEDVALCEFVCTSKMPLQKILREGLEMMRDQG